MPSVPRMAAASETRTNEWWSRKQVAGARGAEVEAGTILATTATRRATSPESVQAHPRDETSEELKGGASYVMRRATRRLTAPKNRKTGAKLLPDGDPSQAARVGSTPAPEVCPETKRDETRARTSPCHLAKEDHTPDQPRKREILRTRRGLTKWRRRVQRTWTMKPLLPRTTSKPRSPPRMLLCELKSRDEWMTKVKLK